MNKAVIKNALVEKGIPKGLIEFGWLRDGGPGVHIKFTPIYALLPLDDGLDLKFADFIYKEYQTFNNKEE